MPLKSLLKSKGLKQIWLAEKLGVSEVTLSNWSSGKSIPNEENLNKLSELLDVPKEILIKSFSNENN